MKVIQKRVVRAKFEINIRFYYYHWVDICARMYHQSTMVLLPEAYVTSADCGEPF